MGQSPFQVRSVNTDTPPGAGVNTKNYAAVTAGDQAKSGAGVFYGLTINTPQSGSSVTLYDGTSTSGKKLGTYATTAQGQVVPPQPATLATGLFVVVASGGTSPDVTVYFG